MNKTKAIFNSAIVLYFIIGLEILIMISPFAGFFYSVFNPVLLGMTKYPATKWLSSFFLPHMVVPPDDFLKFIRIMGSILFVSGMTVFFICAIQVYANKFLKRGVALKGLYSLIRHPQYMGLGIAGMGLSILWPRFLVAVLWLVMILVYYFLSTDEEKRMLKEQQAAYSDYLSKTGMFFPKAIEKVIAPSTIRGKIALFILIAAVTIGGAFFLRDYSIKHLPLWTERNIVTLAVLSEDMPKMEHRMSDILKMKEVGTRLKENENYLVYFLPQQYVMQGLIADTGGDWKLYKRHHTISMITDWIFHPFKHLEGGHHAFHDTAGHAGQDMKAGVVRRLIFLKISNGSTKKPFDVFSINATRTPVFMMDIDIHNLRILDLKDLSIDTGWGTVPTPIF